MDEAKPKRLQIFTERLGCEKNSYELTELCSELKPCSSCQNGRYERIVSNPPVYFYTYETTQQACKAKRSDFTMNILDVGNDEILKPVTSPRMVKICVNSLRVFDTNHVQSLKSFRDKFLNLCQARTPIGKFFSLGEEERRSSSDYDTILEANLSQGGVNDIHEVAVNAWCTNVLQKTLFSSDKFEVLPYSNETDLKICKYARSQQDMVIYHREKYVCDGKISGAVTRHTTQDEDMEYEDMEYTVEDSTMEAKKDAYTHHEPQLMADMFKLAADLCVKAVVHGYTLISGAIIYGQLIDINKDEMLPLQLHVVFNEGCTLRKSRQSINVSEGYHRLHQILTS